MEDGSVILAFRLSNGAKWRDWSAMRALGERDEDDQQGGEAVPHRESFRIAHH